MKSICFVYPWFGKFNSYFDLWLESAKKNESIDFLIYTDKKNITWIKERFFLPNNIRVFASSLSEISLKISKILGRVILLNRPYKLCDYKPFYCFLFEEIKQYDFWGFGDMDVILGDIRHFLSEDILDKCDVIGNMGHMQVFRNVDYINNLIFQTPRDFLNRVLSDADQNYFFDEREYSRFNIYKSDRKKLIWDDVADVRKPSRKFGLKYFRFSFPCDADDKHHKQCCFYDYSDGKLYLTKIVNGLVVKKEVIYLHLQKRTMKNCVKNNHTSFLCLPNRFVKCGNINQIKKKYRFHLIDFLQCIWANKKTYLSHVFNRFRRK